MSLYSIMSLVDAIYMQSLFPQQASRGALSAAGCHQAIATGLQWAYAAAARGAAGGASGGSDKAIHTSAHTCEQQLQ
jgi:hypothetical protein